MTLTMGYDLDYGVLFSWRKKIIIVFVIHVTPRVVPYVVGDPFVCVCDMGHQISP